MRLKVIRVISGTVPMRTGYAVYELALLFNLHPYRVGNFRGCIFGPYAFSETFDIEGQAHGRLDSLLP